MGKLKLIDGGQSAKNIAKKISRMIRKIGGESTAKEFGEFLDAEINNGWPAFDPPPRNDLKAHQALCTNVYQFLDIGIDGSDKNNPLITGCISYSLDNGPSPVQIKVLRGIAKEDAIAVLRDMLSWLARDWDSLVNPDTNE